MVKKIVILSMLFVFQTGAVSSNQTVIKGNRGVAHGSVEVNMDTVIDYDGNQYATVKIGKQTWMAENLKSLHYPDGTKIAEVYAYDDDEKNASVYGRLYTWEAVTGKHNICPDGWHIPTDDDWKQLERYLGMVEEDIEDTGWRETEAEGIKLKKHQKDFLWIKYSQRGVNASGFSALPAGVRKPGGSFAGKGNFTDFWSISGFDAEKAWNRSLVWLVIHYAKTKIYRKPVDKKWGFSARCIKDE